MTTSNQDDPIFWNQRFTRFFRPAYREVELLQMKINQQNGLLIFKWHKYTVEELINSEHHNKIESVSRKIGDDVSNLYKRGVIPEEYKETYEEYKNDLLDDLHEVNKQIYARKPTWLESAWETFRNFVEVVRENMPRLVRNLIEQAGVFIINYLPGIAFFGSLLLPPARAQNQDWDEQ